MVWSKALLHKNLCDIFSAFSGQLQVIGQVADIVAMSNNFDFI